MKAFSSMLDDSGQEVRYLVMRSLRLALMVACEVSGFWLFIVGFWAAIVGLSNWGADPRQCVALYGISEGTVLHAITFHPFAIFIGGTGVGVCLIMLSWAVGIPYRFKTAMPGIHAKVCWKCGVGMVDRLFCQKCGAFRPGRVLTSVVWCASLVVTIVAVTHDVIWAMLTFGAAGRS